jgi:hypothetical protein
MCKPLSGFVQTVLNAVYLTNLRHNFSMLLLYTFEFRRLIAHLICRKTQLSDPNFKLRLHLMYSRA